MRDNRSTRVLLAFLLVVSLTLVLVDARNRSVPGRGVVAGVVGPLQSAASNVTRPVTQFFSDIVNLPNLRREVDQLRQENDVLRGEVAREDFIRSRAEQLDALLRLAGSGSYRIVPAQVVAIGPAQDYTRTITIDAGARDGVLAQMTVLTGRGLVGTVVAVGPTTSTVVLIADRNSRVGARSAATSEIGVVSGDGTLDTVVMQFLTAADPRVGQRVVTRGSVNGRPYVPGVPIGEILSVSGGPGQLQTAVLRPYVSLSALDLVGVVVEPPRTDPRDSVLPSPAPTPTVTVTVTEPAPTATPTSSPRP
jgi:rod shape-determining protein MreC